MLLSPQCTVCIQMVEESEMSSRSIGSTLRVMCGNKLTDLVDLDPLFKMKNIERLSLLDNPVTSKSHYRYYVIYKSSKTLRFLDFQRIKDKERKAADALFSGDRGAQLLIDIAPAKKVVEEEP